LTLFPYTTLFRSIYGESLENLFELFRHPIDGIRHAVRLELSARNTDEVIQKAQEWVAKLDPKKKEDALPMLEILWLHQQHNVINRPLLVKLLSSPEYQARLAAQKVNFFWSGKDTFKPAKSEASVSGMQFRTGYEKFWKVPGYSDVPSVNQNQNQNQKTEAPKSTDQVINPALFAAGATLFTQKCIACHGINNELVGPALKGMDTKYDEAWLIKWIKNAPALIASGDARALKAAEYSPAVMTAFPELSDDDIRKIMAHVKAGGIKPAATPNR
jgi:mono/diheme cytochrome c family protein